MPTAQELRENPALRAGKTAAELEASGLTALEAQTAASGFNEAFGGGRAKAFRAAQTAGQQDIPINEFVSGLVQNPTLPVGGELVPTIQTAQPEEFLTAQQLTPEGAQIAGVQPIGAAPTIATEQAAPAQQIDAAEVLAGVDPTGQQITGTFTSPVETLDPTKFNLSDDALVENRLASLYADIETGQVPAWAKASHNAAMEAMAARGIQGSSIAAGAIVQAIQQSALPIAAADAQTYFQRDLNEFNSEQQASLVNFQARQQNMLTDVSIANATEQFNAASKTQVQQFIASTISQIKTTNAQLTSDIEKFNTNQVNTIAAQNAGNTIAVAQFDRQTQLQVQQFNANLKNNRETWNAQNQQVVDQSNVQWRRGLNTAETAAINAANQVNVQNRMNLSNFALNNMIMEYRDKLAWAFEASESAADRAYNLAVVSGNREYLTDRATGQSLGNLATTVIDKLDFSDLGTAVDYVSSGIDKVLDFF